MCIRTMIGSSTWVEIVTNISEHESTASTPTLCTLTCRGCLFRKPPNYATPTTLSMKTYLTENSGLSKKPNVLRDNRARRPILPNRPNRLGTKNKSMCLSKKESLFKVSIYMMVLFFYSFFTWYQRYYQSSGISVSLVFLVLKERSRDDHGLSLPFLHFSPFFFFCSLLSR